MFWLCRGVAHILNLIYWDLHPQWNMFPAVNIHKGRCSYFCTSSLMWKARQRQTANKLDHLQKCVSILGREHLITWRSFSIICQRWRGAPLTCCPISKFWLYKTTNLLWFCFSLVCVVLSSWSTFSLDTSFWGKTPWVLENVRSPALGLSWESVLPFVVRSNVSHKSFVWENKAFSPTSHPVWCELAGLHRALFEVLCEHKSLLIKVPCSENDLNKHSPRIIPSLGSSNLPQNGGWGQERLEEALRREYLRMWWVGVAERSPFGGCFCPQCITAA